MELPKVLNLIGNTPIVELKKLVSKGHGRIFVKLEYFNPTGSHKDRIALYMIRDCLEKYGRDKCKLLIEASSGNTAISVAWVASVLGLSTLIVVEEDISPHKLRIIESLGAKVIKTRKAPPSHPDNLINVAKRLAKELGGIYLMQHANEANVRAHYETTAKEIFNQLGGRIDVFVMGIGTAGTIAGVGKFLKERLGSKVKVVGVVPKGSPIITGRETVGEPIEGLATSTVPEIYIKYKWVIDNIVEVSYKDALEMMRKLAIYEGILGGLSTGANIWASLKIADELSENSVVVTLAPDSIFRYTHLL
ncbi:MAG TPA: cysteine synthase family protein [Acidilobales archaeon]|nr:cysteine synthase family protein [Acidilobales archaeon]